MLVHLVAPIVMVDVDGVPLGVGVDEDVRLVALAVAMLSVLGGVMGLSFVCFAQMAAALGIHVECHGLLSVFFRLGFIVGGLEIVAAAFRLNLALNFGIGLNSRVIALARGIEMLAVFALKRA